MPSDFILSGRSSATFNCSNIIGAPDGSASCPFSLPERTMGAAPHGPGQVMAEAINSATDRAFKLRAQTAAAWATQRYGDGGWHASSNSSTSIRSI
jgi:hypothetical protein